MTTALAKLAENTGVTTEEITEVVRNMIVSGKNQHGATATNAEMTVVSGICSKYDLNPMMREAHAFISGGKLQVIIGIDGWIKILNRQKDFDGFEQTDNFNGSGELVSVTTKIYIKGRKYPTPHTEYMSECFQPNSAAWKKFKFRMLTNKSLGQCVRIAFGINEIIDDDEQRRITGEHQQQPKDITPKPSVDFDEIEADLAECADLDTLKSVAGDYRLKMQADGTWDAARAKLVSMHNAHKDRISAMLNDEFEDQPQEQPQEEIVDVEFEEVTESV